MVVIHSNGTDDLQQGRLSQDDAEPKTPNTRALAVSASAEKAKPSNTPPKLLDVRMVSVAGGMWWGRVAGREHEEATGVLARFCLLIRVLFPQLCSVCGTVNLYSQDTCPFLWIF